jgi:transcriptional regulator with XRE-family HTH domain
MDAAVLLKDARERSGLTQLEVAERAGVAQSMVSAYEKGKRRPSVATLDRLLKATGWQLVADIEPLGADLDARVERALAITPVERAKWFDLTLGDFAARCEGLPFAVDGLVAALIQGVPVEAKVIDILLADDDEVLATLGPRLFDGTYKVWLEENNRHVWVPRCDTALRVLDPSEWLRLFDVLRIRLCPRERLHAVLQVPFGEIQLPVVPLWEIELEDPAVAAVLARTREILALRRAAEESGSSGAGAGS